MSEAPICIRRALNTDVEGIVQVMEEAVRTMERPEWFVSDDEAFIREHIDSKGFTMIAEKPDFQGCEEGKGNPPHRIGGFLIVKFPGLSEKNLGHTLHMPEENLLRVAHMDSAAVLPSWRGQGLQGKLIDAAERELIGGPYTLLMATVHPENRFSLENFLRRGYTVKATVRRYGGLLRYVLLKDTTKGSV